MVDTAALAAQLAIDEGVRLKPYTDTVGKLTIGIGRNISDRGISRSEAEILLRNDIANTIHELDVTYPWWKSLTPSRQAVMANMLFNMGLPVFSTFTRFLTALMAGNYPLAASEMLNSRWATQTGDRATRLANALLKG